MLISIRDYPICGGTLSGGVAATDLRLRFSRSIEVVQGLGAVNPTLYDRGTRTIDLSFTVTRNHGTIESADVFIAKHERSIPQSGPVKLETMSGSVAYVTNGVLVDFQLINQIGSTTSHSYHITGGLFITIPQEFSYILTEGSDFILTELGDRILIE